MITVRWSRRFHSIAATVIILAFFGLIYSERGSKSDISSWSVPFGLEKTLRTGYSAVAQRPLPHISQDTNELAQHLSREQISRDLHRNEDSELDKQEQNGPGSTANLNGERNNPTQNGQVNSPNQNDAGNNQNLKDQANNQNQNGDAGDVSQNEARSGSVSGGLGSGSGSGLSDALLRIMVLTYNRGKSLMRCLQSLNEASYDGKRVVLEIHIDRSKDGTVHAETLNVSKTFVFRHGQAEVKVKEKHAGVLGQWLTSWRVPPDNTSEIAVFVEDDITLSPFFARYLRMAHAKYDNYPAINGYALQTETIRHAKGAKSSLLQGPRGQAVFLYPVLGSWGFSPNTRHWRDFIQWYENVSRDPDFIPSVPGLLPSDWYRQLRKKGRAETMWTMWHIYHAYSRKLWTLYPNFGRGKALAFNWKEPGEHFFKRTSGLRAHLLEEWNDKEMVLPDRIQILDAKGENTANVMTATGIVRDM